MVKALGSLNEIVVKAKKDIVPFAIKYAWEFKDDSVIYTMGSGPCWGSVYKESICILRDIQWIHSSAMLYDEYLHGNLSTSDKMTDFVQHNDTGRALYMAERSRVHCIDLHNRCVLL